MCLGILAVDGASAEDNCSYQHLFNHLNLSLSGKNDLYTMSRPVKHHNTSIKIHLEVLIYAILDLVSLKFSGGFSCVNL